MVRIGNDWDGLLQDEWSKPYYTKLREFLKEEYGIAEEAPQEYRSGGSAGGRAGDGTGGRARRPEVYPPREDIFNALRLTAYSDVRAVILGQDPYHEPGQAQGLAFSVPYGVPKPPSLVNILKELADDPWEEYAARAGAPGQSGGLAETGELANSGVLVPWARQGVLLLNTVLTVRAGAAGSHRGRGWEIFTDRIIELLAMREQPLVFILWGANAGAKRDLIIRAQTSGQASGPLRHLIIQAPHPSPLSAYRGFFGGRYFSRVNYFLTDNGIQPVDWSLQQH